MSHKDNADLRNTGDGGWFYAEHELFSVFVPLIGPIGGIVYMAMCRLIPLAAVDPDRQVTARAIELESCVARQTATEKRAELVALGMIEETRRGTNRVSTYKLVSLRVLAKVGVEELRRRLEVAVGVRQADTENNVGGSMSSAQQRHGEPQALATGADGNVPTTLVSLLTAASPEASGKNGVRHTDTEADRWKNRRKNGVQTQSVSEKQASVSGKRASVSGKMASVSVWHTPFKEEEEEEEDLTPLPPASGGSDGFEISAGAKDPGNGQSEGKNFADEGQEQDNGEMREVTPTAKREAQLVWAAAQAMRAHSFAADRRWENAIAETFGTWCSKTGRTPQEAVDLEAANYRAWLEQSHLMTHHWGRNWWFKRSNWCKPEVWPYDKQKLAQMQRARIGTDRSVFE